MASTHGGRFRIAGHDYGYITITPHPARVPTLTPAEHAVLDLICAGHSNQEIAAARQVSVNTVGNQVATLLNKLGAANRCDLVALATTVRATPDVSD